MLVFSTNMFLGAQLLVTLRFNTNNGGKKKTEDNSRQTQGHYRTNSPGLAAAPFTEYAGDTGDEIA